MPTSRSRRRPRRRRSSRRRRPRRRRASLGDAGSRRPPRSSCAGAGRAAAPRSPLISPATRSSRRPDRLSLARRWWPARAVAAGCARSARAAAAGPWRSRAARVTSRPAWLWRAHGGEPREVAQRRADRAAGMRSEKSPPPPSSPVLTRGAEHEAAVAFRSPRSPGRHLRPARRRAALQLQRERALDLAGRAAPGANAWSGSGRHLLHRGDRRRLRAAAAPGSEWPPPLPPPSASVRSAGDRQAHAQHEDQQHGGDAAHPRQGARRAPGEGGPCRRQPAAQGILRRREARSTRPRSSRGEPASRLWSVGAQRERQLLQLARGGSRWVVAPASSAASIAAQIALHRRGAVRLIMAGLSQLGDGSVQAGAGTFGSDSPSTRGDLGVGEPAGELESDQVALAAVERRSAARTASRRSGELGVVVEPGRLVRPRDRPPAGHGACAGAARRARRCGRSRTARPPRCPARAGSCGACGRPARRPVRSRPRRPRGHAASEAT